MFSVIVWVQIVYLAGNNRGHRGRRGGETGKGEKPMKCLLVTDLLLRQLELNPAGETEEHALELTC